LMLCPVPKATPSVEPVEVDQGLLTRLEKVSGVKFRGVGRYS
jgi:hypothetical protein